MKVNRDTMFGTVPLDAGLFRFQSENDEESAILQSWFTKSLRSVAIGSGLNAGGRDLGTTLTMFIERPKLPKAKHRKKAANARTKRNSHN